MTQFQKFFDIRDNIIPNGKINEFKEWLNSQDQTLAGSDELVGAAIYHNEINILALLSLFIRENKIDFDKEDIYKSAYYAHCREKSSKASKIGIIVDQASWSELSPKSQNKWIDLCNVKFNY